MLSFEFHCPKTTLVEAGSSARLGELVKGLGGRTALIVTDKGVEQAGLLAAALKGLRDQQVAVEIFSEVRADPPVAVIEAAVERALACRADCVIGLGGGSSMDVAKLAALLALGNERLDQVYGVGLARGPRLPLILVPTTAGTGSEVTPISIVTTGEGEKKGVVSPILLPDIAVLDADLTLGLPAHVTAATGVDAMVHAIEAYTSKRLKNPVSDCLARDALRLLSANIHEACGAQANREVRQNMLLGAMLAGLAFANAPVAGVHALAYPVGARFHVPHGLSNSLVLAAVMRFNLSSAQTLYAELAGIVVPGMTGLDSGSAGARAAALVRHLSGLPAELGLKTRLSEVGITKADLPHLAEDAMRQTRLLVNNPRDIQYQDALAIYTEVL